MALGDLGATNIFSVAGGWHAQSATVTTSQNIVSVIDATGAVACLNEFEASTTATVEYEGCGAASDTITLGGEVGGYIVRSVEVSHEAGQAPRLTVEGVSYAGGTHGLTNDTVVTAAADISAVSSGLTTPVSLDATSVTERYECEVVTQLGGDGEILRTETHSPIETYEESGSGSLGSAPTKTGYTLESWEDSDANQELDTYSCTFKKALTPTV